MSIKVQFGKIIKRLRANAGLSQEELAYRAGMHRTYIGIIERGEKNITLENAYKISKALNIPLSHILKELENYG